MNSYFKFNLDYVTFTYIFLINGGYLCVTSLHRMNSVAGNTVEVDEVVVDDLKEVKMLI